MNNESFIFRGKEKKLCYDFELDEFVFYEANRKLPRNVLLLSDVINQKYSEIGRAHVWTPVTLIYLVCRLLLEKKKKKNKKIKKKKEKERKKIKEQYKES